MMSFFRLNFNGFRLFGHDDLSIYSSDYLRLIFLLDRLFH
jgi:hypothetical protein